MSLSALMRIGRSWLLPCTLVFASGCLIRVYQPMEGLHAPTVVDPRNRNFEDVSLTVHCVPSDLGRGDNARLCQRVSTMFENQGAKVRTVETAALAGDDFGELGGSVDETPNTEVPRTDLTLQIRSRKVDASTDGLSWALCVFTFTLMPGISEVTWAQDIVVRDETGFLLVSDTLSQRFVERFGFGPWTGHQLADLARDKEDRVSNRNAEQDMSADMYRQLSQLVYNAKVQRELLQGPVGEIE